MLARVKSANFAERVSRLLERVEYRRVETDNDMDAILRLRYEAFLREGQIDPQPSGRLIDSFDDSSNTYNIGVFIDRQLAGSLRIHVLAGVGDNSPARESFGEFLLPELQAGKVIIDPNRFVAKYQSARQYPELPYITVRAGFMAAVHFGAQLMTMTVRAEHQAFYRRHFFANIVCPPRPYPLLRKPISLMFMDFAQARQRALELHPYWRSSAEERERLFVAHSRSGCNRMGAVAAA
jgi:N-acyl-L-homoserine lactone synthetase